MSKFDQSRRPNKGRRVAKQLSSSNDEFSDYSEDFENDSRSSSPENYTSNIRNKTRLLDKHDSTLSEDLTSSSIISTTGRSAKKSSQSEGRKRVVKSTARKQGWRSSSLDARKKFGAKDSVQSRMLSAKRNRINNLNNQLCETKIKLDELLKENRLLKTLEHRQSRALRKFEDEENDLPRLISQHNEEQRVLKMRLRKYQDTERMLEGKLRDSNEEMQKMENTLRRLKKMVYDKNLGERSELARQLSNAENQLEDAERKNKELTKKLELTTNSYGRQINSERTKHRETKEQLFILQEEHLKLTAKLKEKERALDVSNIYALRVKQSPEKSFVGGGKVALVSPRQQRQASPKQPLPVNNQQHTLAIQPSPEPQIVATSTPKATGNATDFRRTIKSPSKTPPKPAERQSSALLDLHSTPKEKGDVTKGLNGLRLEDHNSAPVENNEKDRKRSSVFLTASFESPFTTPGNSFIRDEKQNTPSKPPQAVLNDSLNSTSPAQPQSDQEYVDLQESKRRSKESEEQRQKEEQLEKRRKADLLAKLRDVEEDSTSPKSPLGGSKPQETGAAVRKLLGNGSQANKVLVKQDRLQGQDQNPKLVSQDRLVMRKKIDNLLLRSGTVSSDDRNVEDVSGLGYSPKKSSKKLYSFPREVENLHMGVPSTLDVGRGGKKNVQDTSEPDIAFGGYAPTFGTQPKRKSRTKFPGKKPPQGSSESEADEPLLDLTSGKPAPQKSDLLSQLFGEKAGSKQNTSDPLRAKEKSFTSNDGGTAPKVTPRAKPVHSGYPWEKNVMSVPPNQGNGDMNATNGRAFATPAVKAVSSSFTDEDIEEMTL